MVYVSYKKRVKKIGVEKRMKNGRFEVETGSKWSI